MRIKGCFVVIAIALAMVGCRAPQKIHRDQDVFRHALLQMETDQIMDNLVRASKGMPILHIDYGNISGTITDSYNGNIGGSYTDIVAGPITRVLSVMGGVSEQKQLGVVGTPVRDDPGVYTAYLEFLDLENNLIVSPELPPLEIVHIWRCYGDMYYWVPIDRRGDFFNLAMRVTGLRSQPLVAMPFWELTVNSVGVVTPENEGDLKTGTFCRVTIAFNETVKRDSGAVELFAEGKVHRVPVILEEGPMGEDVNHLTIEYPYGITEEDFAEGAFRINPFTLREQLVGRKVKFYAARFRPEAPTADKLLKRIELQLNSIRLDQLRTLP